MSMIFIYTEKDNSIISSEDAWISGEYKGLSHFKKENPDLKPLAAYHTRDVFKRTINEYESKLKAQQELIDELSDLVKTIIEILNVHSRVAIHKDSIVHVRMKRALAKLEAKT